MRAERKRPARASKPRRTPSRSPRRSPQARGASAVQAPPREFGSRNSEYGIGAHDSIPHSDFRVPHWEARVVIEGITPRIDGGRFPIKRTIGDDVIVEADIFTDGHDRIAAVLQYRVSNSEWREAPMREIGNDRWRAQFSVETIGRCEYTIEAWIDAFETCRQGLKKKFDAGQDVAGDLTEGAALVRKAAGVVTWGWGREPLPTVAKGSRPHANDAGVAEEEAIDAARQPHEWLLDQADRLTRGDQVTRVHAALDERLAQMMRQHAGRGRTARYEPPLSVLVDRERARFGAWYEMFPRSAGTDPTRSATFDEAAARLAEIAAMGFDVLYLPPIHPIGRAFRKGRNNALEAQPGEPGSPWAIGSAEGGHTAVEPALGTIEDFDRFVETARHLGLEVALDLAYQASPDHPYVREHPDWFRHRPDGTIKYAENPPKQYQDIYPFDFESADWQPLWEELKDVVLFWIGHGVRIFRVDNPHTKPFPFWEWMLADIRRDHPDAIFLSEAFTRPKVMRYLAKAGFSQSYTYFTWRNTKAELEEYFTELTQTDVREYLRPNLFANTPDILHEYLQQGGRPAFMIRLVLAGTLGATYGVYSGFELCENRPVRPGSEEYLDSEKYQYRPRHWDQPGHIRELIARVNRIRHESPSLHDDWRLRFHRTDNDQIICYSKTTDDLSDVTLVVVNLDYRHMQHGWVQVPLAAWGLPPDATYDMYDALGEECFRWTGEWNYVRLDPETRPAHILTLRR